MKMDTIDNIIQNATQFGLPVTPEFYAKQFMWELLQSNPSLIFTYDDLRLYLERCQSNLTTNQHRSLLEHLQKEGVVKKINRSKKSQYIPGKKATKPDPQKHLLYDPMLTIGQQARALGSKVTIDHYFQMLPGEFANTVYSQLIILPNKKQKGIRQNTLGEFEYCGKAIVPHNYQTHPPFVIFDVIQHNGAHGPHLKHGFNSRWYRSARLHCVDVDGKEFEYVHRNFWFIFHIPHDVILP